MENVEKPDGNVAQLVSKLSSLLPLPFGLNLRSDPALWGKLEKGGVISTLLGVGRLIWT